MVTCCWHSIAWLQAMGFSSLVVLLCKVRLRVHSAEWFDRCRVVGSSHEPLRELLLWSSNRRNDSIAVPVSSRVTRSSQSTVRHCHVIIKATYLTCTLNQRDGTCPRFFALGVPDSGSSPTACGEGLGAILEDVCGNSGLKIITGSRSL